MNGGKVAGIDSANLFLKPATKIDKSAAGTFWSKHQSTPQETWKSFELSKKLASVWTSACLNMSFTPKLHSKLQSWLESQFSEFKVKIFNTKDFADRQRFDALISPLPCFFFLVSCRFCWAPGSLLPKCAAVTHERHLIDGGGFSNASWTIDPGFVCDQAKVKSKQFSGQSLSH